jgi:hypothetical protein
VEGGKFEGMFQAGRTKWHWGGFNVSVCLFTCWLRSRVQTVTRRPSNQCLSYAPQLGHSTSTITVHLPARVPGAVGLKTKTAAVFWTHGISLFKLAAKDECSFRSDRRTAREVCPVSGSLCEYYEKENLDLSLIA